MPSVQDAIVHMLLISLQEKQSPYTPHIAPIIQIPHQINVDSLCSDAKDWKEGFLETN